MDESHRLNAMSDSLDEPFGQPLRGAWWARSPRHRPFASSRGQTIDLVLAIVLTVGLIATSGFLIFMNLFLGFAFDACSDPRLDCNYTLGAVAWYTLPIVAIIVLFATIVLIVKRYGRARVIWWIPCAGIGVVVGTFCFGIALVNFAVGTLPT
ncbi:hypothetical protein ACVXZ4_10440 [Lacisediminihabitans sp. FW035]